MKKALLLWLTFGVISNSLGQDTLATPKGRYVLKDAYFSDSKPVVFQPRDDGVKVVVVPPVNLVVKSESVDVFSSFKKNNGRYSVPGINGSVDSKIARYFLGSVDYRKVLTVPNTGVLGYDYNPLIYEPGENPWTLGNWVQANFYTPGKRAVGPDYTVDQSTRLYEFDTKFPEFNLPKNKIITADYETERSSDSMLKRGVTYAKNTSDVSKRVHFLGDHWLHEVGCPQAYTVSVQDFEEWMRSTSADRILQSFQRNIKPYRNYGYIMLNWEAVMFHVPNDQRHKLVNCLKWYSEQNFNAKLSAWMQAGFRTSRVTMEGDFNYGDYAGISTFTGTESEFRARYGRFSGQPDYARYLDVGLIGGYQNFVTEDGLIHHYLLELIPNKKFYPGKLALASIWHDLEAINWVVMPTTPSGADYVFYNKAAVQNQSMFNWGVWTVAVGDGYHCWSDPIKWTNNVKDYPFAAIDKKGVPLPCVAGKMFARNDLKNIDWLQRGVWEVSQHNDIIDAKTAWLFPIPVEDSYRDKTPLIAYKLSADGFEALTLVLDMWGGEGSHKVELPLSPFGVGSRKIVVNGTFTTVERIKL